MRCLGNARTVLRSKGKNFRKHVEQVREAQARAYLDSEMEHIPAVRDMRRSALTVAAIAIPTLANIAEQPIACIARDQPKPERAAAERVGRQDRRDYDRRCNWRRAGAAMARCGWAGVHSAPTEIVSRTLLQKTTNRSVLAFRDRADLTPDEQEQAIEAFSARFRRPGRGRKCAAPASARSTKCVPMSCRKASGRAPAIPRAMDRASAPRQARPSARVAPIRSDSDRGVATAIPDHSEVTRQAPGWPMAGRRPVPQRSRRARRDCRCRNRMQATARAVRGAHEPFALLAECATGSKRRAISRRGARERAEARGSHRISRRELAEPLESA